MQSKMDQLTEQSQVSNVRRHINIEMHGQKLCKSKRRMKTMLYSHFKEGAGEQNERCR